MATKPWDMPTSGSMFGGAAPTPVYTPTPYGGYGPSAQQIQDAMRSGTYFAPEGSPNPLGPRSNINEPVGGSNTDWLTKGAEALSKALAYKGQTSSGFSSRDYRGYGSNASQVAQGRGYTMYMPGSTQKTTQTGGRSGFGGSIGSILGAGLGLALAPATGGASALLTAAGAGAGLGGALGSAGDRFFT